MFLRFFIHLYGLLAVIWPVPLRAVWLGAVLLVAWVALAPFDAVLSAHGQSAFVLANVILLSVLIWGNMPYAVAPLVQKDGSAHVTRIMMWILGFHLALVGLLLWLNEPLLCQRVLTGGLLLRGFTMVIGLGGTARSWKM